MIPVDSVSASNNPQVSFTVLTNGCGSTQVVPDVVQIYDDTWTKIGAIQNDAQGVFQTNLVTGHTYHVEAYSGNMLIASSYDVIASSSTHVNLCSNEKETLEVKVTSHGSPVPQVQCFLNGYNHYNEDDPWERLYFNPERISDSQGICSWQVYPTTQIGHGSNPGERYKIEYILPNGQLTACKPYFLPVGGHDESRGFDIHSEQANSDVCDVASTPTSQSSSSYSVCDPNDDHSFGIDATREFPIPLENIVDGMTVEGCLTNNPSSDWEDYYTVETDDFYDVSIFQGSGDIQLRYSSSDSVLVGGGEQDSIVVERTSLGSSTFSYTLLFERNNALSDGLAAVSQSESPQLINYGPPVVNCVEGFNTWLQFFIADPSNDLGATTRVEIEGHLDSQVVQVGEPLSIEIDGCSDGLLEMKVIEGGQEITSKQFAVEEFEVLGLTDNVVFIDAFSRIQLSERLEQGNCISIVQVGTRSALGQAAGKADITSTEMVTTPWYCGNTATDSIQFQAKELGSLNNMVFVKFRQGRSVQPQLIFHSNMYVLPRCSDQVSTGDVDEVSSYLFVDCEGNEAGLIVYQDDGAGDLDQNSWQHIKSWNEDTHMVMFTNTKMVAPSEEEVEYIDLMIPTLIKRCHESDFNLNYVRDPDPGPGGVFNFLEIVGTFPEFAESSANLERVESGLSTEVMGGDCLAHSEYVRSVGHSIAIMPDIDDWESMAFVPATETSLSRMTEWCTEYGFRCDPVTRDSPSWLEYGPFDDCQLWTAYSIIIKAMEEPPDPSSFQWEGRMGFYEPENQSDWYQHSMTCFGKDLKVKARISSFVNFAFLLIDIIAVASIVATGGASIMIVGVGMFGKKALKAGFKASSRKVTGKVTQNGINAKGFDVKFTRQFEEMKSHWRLGGAPNDLTRQMDTISEKILKHVDNEVLNEKQFQHIGMRMNRIIKRCDPDDPVAREKMLDYFEDFTQKVDKNTDATILELDGLAEASKKFSRHGNFPGPDKWGEAKKPKNQIGNLFEGSQPDFVFNNVLIDGLNDYGDVVLEVKTTLSNQIGKNQFKNVKKWADGGSNRHVIYFTKESNGWKSALKHNLIDGVADDAAKDVAERWEIWEKKETKLDNDIIKTTRLLHKLIKKTSGNWEWKETASSVFDLTRLPAFSFPDALTIGRSTNPQSLLLSSTCSDESILVTYGAELDYGVLWAWLNITATEIQILHHSNCDVLVSGVQWNTPVEQDENGTVIATNSDVVQPTWEEIGLQYVVEDEGVFVNQPPRFIPFEAATSQGIQRADGLILYMMEWNIDEGENDHSKLRYDFSSIVDDVDGEHGDLYISVTESPNCKYREYFFIDVDGLNLSITPIQNASTDSFGDNPPHQTIPNSGFHCEVILALYDSPFTPEHFPSHDSYTQGVSLTTIGIRISNIDDVGHTASTETSNASLNWTVLTLLLLVAILLFAAVRHRD